MKGPFELSGSCEVGVEGCGGCEGVGFLGIVVGRVRQGAGHGGIESPFLKRGRAKIERGDGINFTGMRDRFDATQAPLGFGDTCPVVGFDASEVTVDQLRGSQVAGQVGALDIGDGGF